MMYLRFVTCLTVGLFGVSLVLMTVYDTLLQDWDVVKDIRLWAARVGAFFWKPFCWPVSPCGVLTKTFFSGRTC